MGLVESVEGMFDSELGRAVRGARCEYVRRHKNRGLNITALNPGVAEESRHT